MAHGRILKTKKYGLFKRCTDNRPCEPERRKALMHSMKKYGWLASFPMSCKLDKGVLIVKDGQHRLAIAEILQIEVVYVLESVDFDVAEVNSAQKTWVTADYAMRWANQGKEEFAKVLAFHEENRVPLGQAFAILAGTSSFSNVNESVKNGTYKITDLPYAESIVSIYKAFINASETINRGRILEACIMICRVPGFNTSRLIGGINKCRDKLVAYSTVDANLRMIEEIYNHGRQMTVPLKFEAESAMKQRNLANLKRKKELENALSNTPLHPTDCKS